MAHHDKLFPLSLLEREIKSRITQHHEMAKIGSKLSRTKRRVAANSLGDFLAWLRETSK